MKRMNFEGRKNDRRIKAIKSYGESLRITDTKGYVEAVGEIRTVERIQRLKEMIQNTMDAVPKERLYD